MIKFVVVSANDAISLDLNKLKDDTKFSVSTYYNNSQSLAEIYNSELSKIRNSTQKFDFILFIHSDVQIDIDHLISHLYECKDKYDVFGLCGTEVTNVSQSPLNWFTSSRFAPNKRWGCVHHGELGNTESFFNSDRFNITDHAVTCIDGLCIVFGENAIKSDMIFDTAFKFDQYDTDISFQTILTYKLRLGVIVERSLCHFSVGKSILSDQFLLTEITLREKWNLGFPENSKIKELYEQSKT